MFKWIQKGIIILFSVHKNFIHLQGCKDKVQSNCIEQITLDFLKF